MLCSIAICTLLVGSGDGLYGSSTHAPEITSVRAKGRRFGAEADKAGPIGGGQGYLDRPEGREHVVTDLDGLLEALGAALAGESIFLPGATVIDCTAMVLMEGLVIELPGGVTLASDRGVDGSPGALLFSDELKTSPLLRIGGEDARVSGLRLRGPDPERRLDHHRRTLVLAKDRDLYYQLPTSAGIDCSFDRLRVDNCELAGWSHAAIYLRRGTGHRVDHSFLHRNQRQGLGYGVCLDIAEALIERNLFDWNRHSIAATGRPGSGYEARHNVERGESLSHLFDMHGGRDRKDGTNIAGTWMKVTHNAFFCTKTAVKVRGEPEERVWVDGNWFVHESPGQAVRGESRTHLGTNAYGLKSPRVIEGR